MKKRSASPGAIRSVEDRLLAAAVEVFLEKGFAASSIDEIAAKAKASKLTFYKHFGSKDGLFEAVVIRENAALLELLEGSMPTGLPMKKFLITVAGRLHTALLEKDTVALARVLQAEAERFPRLADVFDKAGPAKATQLLAVEFKRHMALGTLRTSDPILAAEHFLHLCLGELTRRILLGVRPALSKAEINKRIAGGVDVFLRGYSALQKTVTPSRPHRS